MNRTFILDKNDTWKMGNLMDPLSSGSTSILVAETFLKPLEKSIPAKVRVTSVSVQFICMGIARDGDGCSSVSILSGPAVPSACCLVFPWTEATRSHAQALQWKLPSWWTYECFQVCTKNEPSAIRFRIWPVAWKSLDGSCNFVESIVSTSVLSSFRSLWSQ